MLYLRFLIKYKEANISIAPVIVTDMNVRVKEIILGMILRTFNRFLRIFNNALAQRKLAESKIPFS